MKHDVSVLSSLWISGVITIGIIIAAVDGSTNSAIAMGCCVAIGTMAAIFCARIGRSPTGWFALRVTTGIFAPCMAHVFSGGFHGSCGALYGCAIGILVNSNQDFDFANGLLVPLLFTIVFCVASFTEPHYMGASFSQPFQNEYAKILMRCLWGPGFFLVTFATSYGRSVELIKAAIRDLKISRKDICVPVERDTSPVLVAVPAMLSDETTDVIPHANPSIRMESIPSLLRSVTSKEGKCWCVVAFVFSVNLTIDNVFSEETNRLKDSVIAGVNRCKGTPLVFIDGILICVFETRRTACSCVAHLCAATKPPSSPLDSDAENEKDHDVYVGISYGKMVSINPGDKLPPSLYGDVVEVACGLALLGSKLRSRVLVTEHVYEEMKYGFVLVPAEVVVFDQSPELVYELCLLKELQETGEWMYQLQEMPNLRFEKFLHEYTTAVRFIQEGIPKTGAQCLKGLVEQVRSAVREESAKQNTVSISHPKFSLMLTKKMFPSSSQIASSLGCHSYISSPIECITKHAGRMLKGLTELTEGSVFARKYSSRLWTHVQNVTDFPPSSASSSSLQWYGVLSSSSRRGSVRTIAVSPTSVKGSGY